MGRVTLKVTVNGKPLRPIDVWYVGEGGTLTVNGLYVKDQITTPDGKSREVLVQADLVIVAERIDGGVL